MSSGGVASSSGGFWGRACFKCDDTSHVVSRCGKQLALVSSVAEQCQHCFLYHIGSHFRWSRKIVLLSLLCGGIRKERSLLPDCFYNHLRASKLISMWLFIAGFHAEMRVITIQALLGDWYWSVICQFRNFETGWWLQADCDLFLPKKKDLVRGFIYHCF